MSAGRQAAVKVGHFVDERIKNVRAGHDDEHQAQDHAGQRRQVAAHAAALQGIVDGSGEQGDDDAPEDDIEEGAQHPEESQRDAGQQQEEGAIFKTVVAFEHGDSLPGLRAASVRDSFRYRKRRGQANRLPLRLRSPAVSVCVSGRPFATLSPSGLDAGAATKACPAMRRGTTRGVFPHVLPAGETAGTSRRGREGGGGRERMSPRPYGVPCPYGVPAPGRKGRLAKGRPVPSCGGGMVKVL